MKKSLLAIPVVVLVMAAWGFYARATHPPVPVAVPDVIPIGSDGRGELHGIPVTTGHGRLERYFYYYKGSRGSIVLFRHPIGCPITMRIGNGMVLCRVLSN